MKITVKEGVSTNYPHLTFEPLVESDFEFGNWRESKEYDKYSNYADYGVKLTMNPKILKELTELVDRNQKGEFWARATTRISFNGIAKDDIAKRTEKVLQVTAKLKEEYTEERIVNEMLEEINSSIAGKIERLNQDYYDSCYNMYTKPHTNI